VPRGFATWLRLSTAGSIQAQPGPPACLASRRNGCDFDVWRPILLWHITRDEFLLRDFLLNWLFPAYEAGALRLRTEDLHSYLRTIRNRGA